MLRSAGCTHVHLTVYVTDGRFNIMLCRNCVLWICSKFVVRTVVVIANTDSPCHIPRYILM